MHSWFFYITLVSLFQDLIIFPDDCEFKHVPACTTGRVYLLKFKTSNRKFFFWVQVTILSWPYTLHNYFYQIISIFVFFFYGTWRKERQIRMKKTVVVLMRFWIIHLVWIHHVVVAVVVAAELMVTLTSFISISRSC